MTRAGPPYFGDPRAISHEDHTFYGLDLDHDIALTAERRPRIVYGYTEHRTRIRALDF